MLIIKMKNKIIILIAIMFIAGSSVMLAEQIKGKVSGLDANMKPSPLKNARIIAVPSMKGAMSDTKGEFSFEISNDSLLIISYIGYKTDTLQISNISNKQNINVQMQNIELEGIEVGGSKVASQLTFSGGVKTETITTRGLHKAACCNLSESFTTTPSVDVQYTDAVTGAKRIQLLGLQSIYSQIQQENIPIMRGLASSYGFAFVPGQWLQSISISKGASTVKNGFESISGLIDISYKKPEDENPTTLNLYTNDALVLELNADHTINFNERTGTTFFLHGNYLNRELDHNNDGFIDKPMGNQINFMQRFHTGYGIWDSKLSYQIMLDNRKGGQMGYHSEKDGDEKIENINNLLWGMENKTQRYNINMCNGFMLNEAGMNIGTILSFTHHNQELYFGRKNFANINYDIPVKRELNGEQNSFYMNMMFQTPLTEAEHPPTLTVGANLLYDNYREEFNVRDAFWQKNTNHTNIMTPGTFVELSYNPITNLGIVAGLRADYVNIKSDTNTWVNPNDGQILHWLTEGDSVFLSPRLHLKYGLIPDTFVIAGSVGKGFRVARELAENTGYFASSRNIVIASYQDKLSDGKNGISINKLEEAWNYGANIYYTTELFGCPVDFNVDFYRTDFINQLVIDLDMNPDEVNLYSLSDSNGKSYSNAFQVDATFQPITNFFITAAYRMNDVKQTTAGKLREKPLQSKHKSFLNLQYNTEMNEWAFDFTIDYNGSGRLPIDANKMIKKYDPFVLMNAQITRTFSNFDVYVGVENLTNYKIKDAIKGGATPFAPGFDASMIYGPIMGSSYHIGVRYKIY